MEPEHSAEAIAEPTRVAQSTDEAAYMYCEAWVNRQRQYPQSNYEMQSYVPHDSDRPPFSADEIRLDLINRVEYNNEEEIRRHNAQAIANDRRRYPFRRLEQRLVEEEIRLANAAWRPEREPSALSPASAPSFPLNVQPFARFYWETRQALSPQASAYVVAQMLPQPIPANQPRDAHPPTGTSHVSQSRETPTSPACSHSYMPTPDDVYPRTLEEDDTEGGMPSPRELAARLELAHWQLPPNPRGETDDKTSDAMPVDPRMNERAMRPASDEEFGYLMIDASSAGEQQDVD